MAVSKVILNGDVLMDVTQDTVSSDTLLSGQTATGADGVRLTGSASVPQPSDAAPSMDGTAAVGSSTKYAREDHVHPTDTSRQAALVSGTNIKTINGESILGSGDLAVGGSVSMTEEEVDAAVEAAWPVVLHTITRQGSAADNSRCKYIGLADPTSLGTYITEAETATTVYVATDGGYALSAPTPNTLVKSDYIDGSWSRVYSFVMPDSDVTVDISYDD